MPKEDAAKDGGAEFRALQQVHTALLPLTADQRGRVIAAVTTLLATSETGTSVIAATPGTPWSAPTRTGRPMSLVELLNDKAPATSAGKITLFAYHREKNEGKPRFSRDDLRPYFSQAHETPPANFDRDFIAAVTKGWIHEDGSESYITTRGITEVEAGFPNERKHSKIRKRKQAPTKTRKRAAR